MEKQRFTAINEQLVFHRGRWEPLIGAIVISSAMLIGSTASGGEQMPDFARMDVNLTSAKNGQIVSPLDYEGKVSGWYFGHAT